MSMILNLDVDVKFYCYGYGVDMRKGIHSLYGLIKQSGDFPALNGDGFVFIGTSLKSIKILRWQRDGFVLYHKKLELGRFSLPQKRQNEPFYELKSDELDKILSHVKQRSAISELKLKIISTI